jgi:hypothetical protein
MPPWINKSPVRCFLECYCSNIVPCASFLRRPGHRQGDEDLMECKPHLSSWPSPGRTQAPPHSEPLNRQFWRLLFPGKDAQQREYNWEQAPQLMQACLHIISSSQHVPRFAARLPACDLQGHARNAVHEGVHVSSTRVGCDLQ